MSQIEIPEVKFMVINVVDVLIRKIPIRNGYQLFINNGYDLDMVVQEHTAMMEHAIVYGEKRSAVIRTWYGRRLPFISGFIERYGRIPTLEDKIQIIATDYFKVRTMRDVFYVESQLDFNVLI